MRKTLILVFACMLLCGGVHAQNVKGFLSDIASKIGNKTVDAPINDGKLVTVDLIKGKWAYADPVILYDSKNLLSKATGLLSDKVEKELGEQLKKYNIEKDSVFMEFSDSSKLVCVVGKDTVNGKYVLSGKVVQFAVGDQAINGNISICDSTLQVLFTADRLFAFVKSINTKDISDLKMSTLTKLAGMKENVQFGLALRRKK